jgi:hypothetical protein
MNRYELQSPQDVEMIEFAAFFRVEVTEKCCVRVYILQEYNRQ